MNVNPPTNGSSLEDCFTNLIALADLSNIKWRGLEFSGTPTDDPLDCPVLSTYGKCSARDLLCVWRRVVNNRTFVNNEAEQQKSYSKELWCFWFDQEPDWKNLLHHDLTEIYQGTWEHGLSYDTRTLLFKSFHNLIEKTLVARGYALFGKHFVQPLDIRPQKEQDNNKIFSTSNLNNPNSPNNSFEETNTQLSFSINFFIHGESIVCANVDVRQKPAIYRLSKHHLANAHNLQTPISVILAPNGLKGTLTGQSFKESDSCVQKMLNDWRKFYSLPDLNKDKSNSSKSSSNWNASSSLQLDTVDNFFSWVGQQSNNCYNGYNASNGNDILPPVVEVVVADVKMKYPSNLVFLVGNQANQVQTTHLISNEKVVSTKNRFGNSTNQSIGNDFNCFDKHQFQMPNISPRQPQLPTISYCIRNNVSQEINHSSESTENCEDITSAFSNWEINDLTCRAGCVCFRCKPSKSNKSKDGGKSNANTSSSLTTTSSTSSFTTTAAGSSNSPPKKEKEKDSKYPGTPGKQSKSGNGGHFVPFHKRFVSREAEDCPSLSTDTLFDCPPRLNNGNKNKSEPNSLNANSNSNKTTQDANSSESPKSLVNGENAVDSERPNESPAISFSVGSAIETPATNGKDAKPSMDTEMFSPMSAGRHSMGSPGVQWTPTATLEGLEDEPTAKACELNSESNAGSKESNQENDLKTKPSNHASKEASKSGSKLHSINFVGGIKRPLLPAETSLLNNSQACLGKENNSLLYDFTYVTEIHDWEQPRPKNRRMIRGLHTSDSLLCNGSQALSSNQSTNQLTPTDPYDTSELDHEFDCKSASAVNGESDQQQQTSTLTRESDLAVSYRDLDQIFDSSSEEEGADGTGNRLRGNDHRLGQSNSDDVLSMKNCLKNGPSSILNVAELTRMFPTPPSLEPNAAPSPYSITLTVGESTPGTEDHPSQFRSESLYLTPSFASTSPEPIRDTQCQVYSAPLQTKFISSSKYAPLANIPSMSSNQLPSQCNYKPSSVPSSVNNGNANNHMLSSSNSNAKLLDRSNSIVAKSNLPPKNPLAARTIKQEPGLTSNTKSSVAITPSSLSLKKLDSLIKANSNSSSNLACNSPQMLPEMNSLIVNLVLSDSLLNVFKDHNFDSCPLCVCNMNIKGFDIDVYLPDTLLRNDEPQYKCSCGFSAIQNRHLSCFAGLFFEDEFEVSGVCYDPIERLRKTGLAIRSQLDQVDPNMLELLKSQCASLFSSSSALFKSFQYEWFNENQTSLSIANRDKENVDETTLTKQTNNRLPVLLNNNDKIFPKQIFLNGVNALLRSDSCEIGFLALMLGRAWLDCWPNRSKIAEYNRLQQVRTNKEDCVHEWLFMHGSLPENNGHEVRCLRRLHRLLSEGLLSKCIASAIPRDMMISCAPSSGTANSSSSSSSSSSPVAPLTWKQFYKLSGRSEDQSEPQPIPSLLVAHERDWVALSPFALKYWEKLALEPYSFSRDIAYIVVCPDSSHLLNNVKSFFKDLSATYQMLHLGKHRSIDKLLIDGVMRVGKATKKLADEPVDDWFSSLGNTSLAAKLKMYAQACRHYIAPHLKNLTLDRTLISDGRDSNASSNAASTGASASNANTSSNFNANNSGNNTNSGNANIGGMSNNNSGVKSPGSEFYNGNTQYDDNDPNSSGNSSTGNSNASNACGNNSSQNDSNDTDDEQRQPHIVIYMVEPFTFTGLDEATYRLACHGLMRCHLQLLQSLPESVQQHVHLQLISMDAVIGTGRDPSDCTRNEQLRSLAFSVFRQCRRVYAQQPLSKSLTGFGPAASLDAFLKLKDSKDILPPARLYLPPFVLAPLKDKQTELGEMFGDRREQSQILFASYCLTEDQRYLLVTCSNERGELSDNTVISVAIPNRHQKKRTRVLQFALHKMMQFLIGVMSQATQPWRLVLGRLGRVGHGELRVWSTLLARRQLQAYSKQLRDRCRQCSLLNTLDTPCILSACLTSLEPDSRLRVFADQFAAGSNPAHTCTLTTPEDASCTHVLVFPTSSTTQSSQCGFQMDPLGTSIAEDDILQALGADAGDDLAVDDIFEWGSPVSPGQDQSTTQLDSPIGRTGPFDGMGGNLKNIDGELREEPLQLLQQPLSLGYYVSTAQTGKLPRWFWTSCPHLEANNPSFLKSALLLHTPSVYQVNDDFFSHQRNSHPLDSNLTTDVLRYVLESYNFLSWLSLDPSTHDRMSCLPVHIQMLMQLYHTVQALL